MQNLTTRERVAHLLRRFGLGASKLELDFYEKLGVDGTLERLINYADVDEGFDVSVFAFSFKNNNDIRALVGPAVQSHWTLRLLTTQRPLQEKLTLFWHDHFAVSAATINNGILMWQYLETLRKYANSDFRTLLHAASKDPAMLLWLNNNENVKGKPNENFAREVMELFTVGIGNYNETDIQEAARAFTGWAFAPNPSFGRRIFGDDEALKAALETRQPLFTFLLRQRLHDADTKTVLGKTGNLTGEDVLDHLCRLPQTPRYLLGKMWEWFAYSKPEPAVIDRLAKVYFDTNYDIKKILFTIAESNEFWSAKCLRTQIKNPVDFAIAAARSTGMGSAMLAACDPNAGVFDRLPPLVAQPLRGVQTALANQGMSLLFPPDVAGWDWGAAWISTATMVERVKFASLLLQAQGGRSSEISQSLVREIVAQGAATSSRAIVAKLLQFFDAKLPEERIDVLEAACDSEGGSAALAGRQGGALVHRLVSLVFATPEFHLC